MRYLMIDRITRLEVHTAITAVKCVALSEDVFLDHFAGAPVLPGALMIESMAQASTALLEYSSEFRRKALLVMVEHAKFRRIVRPGELLTVGARVSSSDGDSARLDCIVTIGRDPVGEASLTFVLQEADLHYPRRTRHLVEAVYDTWLHDAVVVPPSAGGPA